MAKVDKLSRKDAKRTRPRTTRIESGAGISTFVKRILFWLENVDQEHARKVNVGDEIILLLEGNSVLIAVGKYAVLIGSAPKRQAKIIQGFLNKGFDYHGAITEVLREETEIKIKASISLG